MFNPDVKTVVKFITIVIIVVLFICLLYSCDGKKSAESFHNGNRKKFDNDTKKTKIGFGEKLRTVETNPIEYKQDDVPVIYPPQYNAYDDTIQSGSKFIPQNQYYTTEGVLIDLNASKNGKTGFADDNSGIGDYGLNFNQCSPACCSDQWPLPFKLPVDKMTCESEDTFVPTSYFCNNGWQDSGCLCMRKDQNKFIMETRGLNTDS